MKTLTINLFIGVRKFFLIFVTILPLVSCSSTRHITGIEQIDTSDKRYIVDRDIDLKGKEIHLPEGVTLLFNNHTIKNGTLVGNNTELKYNRACFDNLKIRGSWNVPIIKSSMFVNCDGNDIREMMNLQNASVYNDITIEQGDYRLNVYNERSALTIRSNADLHILGNLYLEPQTNERFYNGYYIISVINAKNVKIDGSGSLIGDEGVSKVKPGYGHGVFLYNVDDVKVSCLTIKDVHGDGIAVSIGCKKVIIYDVAIDNYHRNGISIVEGEEVMIDNVHVRNGGKDSPYAAIDVEPNAGCHVRKVVVNNLDIYDCAVGISGCVTTNASVEDISYNNINMQRIGKACVISSSFGSLSLSDVSIKDSPLVEYVFRLIANQSVDMKNVSADLGNCTAKYPFYISGGTLTVENSCFSCPQLFSWHLANAVFVDTEFRFKSFVWTASNLSTANVSFEHCRFYGPMMMRPENVDFKNSEFYYEGNGTDAVRFEEKVGMSSTAKGVVFEDNRVIQNRTANKTKSISVNVRNSSVKNNKIITNNTDN